MNVLFRTDCGPKIGFGHLSRCQSLAKYLELCGGTASFLIGPPGVQMPCTQITGTHVTYLPSERTGSGTEVSYLQDLVPASPNAILFDVAHDGTFADLNCFWTLLELSNKIFDRTIVLDSFGRFSLRSQAREIETDLVIAPYVGEESRVDDGVRVVAGGDYFILNPDFHAYLGPRKISDKIRCLLLTCGGSDPQGVTLKVMSVLGHSMFSEIEARIAIGPGFSNELVEKIEVLAAQMQCRAILLRGENMLAAHMRWCDLAISMSGLTKYELAATGTPAVLLSVDNTHAEIHEQSFAGLGTARHLGVWDRLTAKRLAQEIMQLEKDVIARQEMSGQGRAAIDGRGGERLIKEIGRLSYAST